MLGDGERDAGHEGRDQAVAPGGVGEAEREQREPERVDALVVVGDAAAREAAQDAARRQNASTKPITAPTATSPSSSSAGVDGVAAGRREHQEEEHERQRQPVVEPRLEVERVPDDARHAARRDDGGGDDRVGRRQHRTEQEAFGPVERREEQLARQRDQPHRDRHRDDQRARGRAPVPAEQLALDEQPVGEQRQDQRQLDRVRDRVGPAVDRHDVDGGQRRRRPPRPARTRSGCCPGSRPDSAAAAATSAPEHQQGLGEVEAHAATALTSWRSPALCDHRHTTLLPVSDRFGVRITT